MTALSGALVVVTGAATGIGRALACEAAHRGAEVVAVDVDDPGETVAIISAAGGAARGLTCDVRDESAMRAVASEICGESGRVHVVCANAGIGLGGDIDSATTADFRAIIDVNVLGTFQTVQAFLPALDRAAAAGGPAAVLITGSEHSLGVPPHVPPMLAYTTSKHALLGFAGCLRRDLSGRGIGVSLLCPGYVRTERLQGFATVSPEIAATLETYGQDSDAVARLAFDGVANGAFVIPTNRRSREFVVETHSAIIDAMQRVEPT